MTTSADLDPAIKSALNHLHSTQLSSASDIRVILDSIIKKQHGFSKCLINRLSKKQLAEEESAPGVMASLPEPLEILDSPPPPEETETENEVLQIDTTDPDEAEDIEMNDEDFNDLNCIICGSIMYSATNRLHECTECHSLYHQQCHSPNIEDDLFQDIWICSNCKDKAKTPIPNVGDSAFPTTKSSSSSSASSASSSPYHKSAEVPPSKTTSSKSSSSSSSLKEDSKAGTKLISSSHSSSRSEKTHSSSSGKKHKSGSSSSKSSSSKDHDRKSKKSK